MIDEINKNIAAKQQVIFDRILYVHYNRYGFNPMHITPADYWTKSDGYYENEQIRSLNVLLDKGWSIVTVTKAFFTYKDGSETKTHGVETAVLEKTI